VLATQLEITAGTDKLVRYESSPGAFRSFCGTCGSQLFMHYDAEPARAYVTFASFTSLPDREPDRHLGFEEHVPWFSFHDGLPRLRGKSSEPA
jgi:hypothetical protein